MKIGLENCTNFSSYKDSSFLFYLSNRFYRLYRSSHYRDHEVSIIPIVNQKRIGSADRLRQAVVLLVNTHPSGGPYIVGVQSRQRQPSRFMCSKLAHYRVLPSAWIADLAGHARLIVPPFVHDHPSPQGMDCSTWQVVDRASRQVERRVREAFHTSQAPTEDQQ